jgi:hypothetical protein
MKTRFLNLAALCMLIPAMLLAQPAQTKTIVGVWEVKMAPVGQSQSPLLSLAMWKAGLANGFQRVQDTLFLSESGDEYTGHALSVRSLYPSFFTRSGHSHICACRSFAYFNTRTEQWDALQDTYNILVGASSQDLPLSGQFKLTSEFTSKP